MDAAAGWERTAPAPLQTVCLRHLPPAGADADAHNLAIAERVNRAGRAYVTPAVVKGRRILRVSIGAEGTERRHVEAVWRELREAASASGP